VSEGGGQVTVTVSRVGGSAGAVSVRYATTGGTAAAGPDYDAASGTLTWADGDTTPRTFTVTVLDDSSDEPNDTIDLTLSDPTGGATVGATGTAVLTISDNDPPLIPPPPPLPPPLPPPPPPPTVNVQPYAVGTDRGAVATATLYNPDGTIRFTLTPFDPSFTGGVRVATADVNGDGTADLIAGTGPGAPTEVVVRDGATRQLLAWVGPFERSFAGGVYVSAADLDGDGAAEVVVTPDEGGGPVVAVYSGAKLSAGQTGDAAQVARFFGIEDPAFRGGAQSAVGDVNADGTPDLVVAAGFLGGPRVAVFDGRAVGAGGRPSRLVADFFAFEPSVRNGVYVAAGDVDGDGFAELVAGGGPGGGPRLTAFSGRALLGNEQVPVANFFAGDTADRGGLRVAARDVDADGRADLLAGAGAGAGSQVTVYYGRTITPGGASESAAFDALPGFGGGVFVG
jgi:hypothetical protein